MKASELIKHLQTISDGLNFDPEVVVDITGGKVYNVEFGGTEGCQVTDYPTQETPYHLVWAKAHLKVINYTPSIDYCDCEIKLEMFDMEGHKCANCGKPINPKWEAK